MTHRLFIAVDLPSGLQTDIQSLQVRLDRLQLPVVWSAPEKIHLTLNFLGRVKAELQPSLIRLLTQIAATHSQFSLTPGFLDTMYKKHADSFVYLGLSGDIPQLKQLHQFLSESLTQLSLPQPRRMERKIIFPERFDFDKSRLG